jgi:hypothetical protein
MLPLAEFREQSRKNAKNLEHVPEKRPRFSDKDMLSLFEVEPIYPD